MFSFNNLLVINTVYDTKIAICFCLILTVHNVFGTYRNMFKRHQFDEYRMCASNFEIHQDKIIRTEESKKMGAKYLNGKDVTSKEECIKFCCDTLNCDVFVLEEKVFNQQQGTCYLFECGAPDNFKCKFTRHHNYSSAVLISRPQIQLEDEIRYIQHEHELTNLRTAENSTKSVNCDHRAKGTLHAVNDESNFTEDIKETPKSVDEGFDNGFKKNSKCSRFQFQCHSSGECIAIYNACDGIPQCADQSDEDTALGCPTNVPLLSRNLENIQPAVEKHENNDKSLNGNLAENFLKPLQSSYRDKNVAEPAVPVAASANQNLVKPPKTNYWLTRMNQPSYNPITGYNSKPQNEMNIPYGYGEYTNGEGNAVFDNGYGNGNAANTWHTKPNLNTNLDRKNFDGHKNKGNPVYYYEENNAPLKTNHNNITRTTKYSNEDKSVPTQTSNFTENMSVKLTTRNTQQSTLIDSTTIRMNTGEYDAIAELKSPEHLDNERNLHRQLEKQISVEIPDTAEQYLHGGTAIDDYVQQPTGAFVSLTIGLCVIAVMIFLIACRLKIVRKRIRRGGKLPYAHDADFLVNGMYL